MNNEAQSAIRKLKDDELKQICASLWLKMERKRLKSLRGLGLIERGLKDE